MFAFICVSWNRHEALWITTFNMVGTFVLTLSMLGRQGKVLPPDLVGSKADWISPAVSLKDLRGKVVLLDFWDYTCVNCVRTFPYLREWNRRYKDKGLVMVGIHTPEFPFERDPKNVKAAVKRYGLPFVVLNDPKSANWERYGIEFWPTKILIAGDGRPVFKDEGEGNYDVMERHIQEEIRKIHPGVSLPPLMKALREVDQPGAVCRPATPELYAGARGLEDERVNYSAGQVGKLSAFTIPAERRKGRLYLGGRWTPSSDCVVSGASDSVASLYYLAKEVNAVLRPNAGPVDVEVLQDGEPVDAADLGDDLKLVGGRSVMRVDEPRMYSILKNHEWRKGEIQLRASRAGLRLYTFAFSTDCAYPPTKK